MTHQESVVSEIFKKRFTVFLIFSVIAASTLCVQPMYAQSSVGVGLVALSGSNGSGLSVRFKNFQVMGGGKFSSSPDPMRGVRLEQLGVAIRYNHSLHEWKRIRFKVFGQLGGYENSMQDPESSSSIRYHFTGSTPNLVDRGLSLHRRIESHF